jgi:hypothetical protein
VFFQVVKNTLAVRALEGTGKEKLADHFRGNIGVVIANEDAIATAKVDDPGSGPGSAVPGAELREQARRHREGVGRRAGAPQRQQPFTIQSPSGSARR